MNSSDRDVINTDDIAQFIDNRKKIKYIKNPDIVQQQKQEHHHHDNDYKRHLVKARSLAGVTLPALSHQNIHLKHS